MNGIKSIGGSYGLNFKGFFCMGNKSKEPNPNKILFMDQHLLEFGIPKRVAFVQDGKYCATTVILYDKNNDVIYSERMSDESAEDAKFLFETKGVDDFVCIKDIKGGKHREPEKELSIMRPQGKAVPVMSLKAENLSLLRPKDRQAVLDALNHIKAESKEKTYLRHPAILDDSSDDFSMSYITFVMRSFESGFDFDKVLENLNNSTKNSFLPEIIERVTVSPDGMLMRIVTADGKRASLDFNDGKRMIYDSNIDKTGFGDLLIMDKNGPVVKEQRRQHGKR